MSAQPRFIPREPWETTRIQPVREPYYSTGRRPVAVQQRQPYPTQPRHTVKAAKKRHVFMWVFLGLQALFLLWVIAGAASGHGNSADGHTQAVTFCANGGWKGLYSSYNTCVSQYGHTLGQARDAGTAIGVGVIVVFWAVADFILGISYAIYRLAKRA